MTEDLLRARKPAGKDPGSPNLRLQVSSTRDPGLAGLLYRLAEHELSFIELQSFGDPAKNRCRVKPHSEKVTCDLVGSWHHKEYSGEAILSCEIRN